MSEGAWTVLGLAGQGAFFGSMLVQWMASEVARTSIIPPLYWWMRLLGGAILTIYAIHLTDPVYIAGSVFGMGIYARNLVLFKSSSKGPKVERKLGLMIRSASLTMGQFFVIKGTELIISAGFPDTAASLLRKLADTADVLALNTDPNRVVSIELFKIKSRD